MIWQISRQRSCIEFTAELLHGCRAAVASATLHDQLRWLDVPDRVLFKLAVTVHQCLNGRAPPYLSEHCIPVADGHLLAVPRFRLNTYGRRAFSVAGPMAWNHGVIIRLEAA